MVKKTVVIYKSKYGSTKKYAQWLAAALGADILDAQKISAKDIAPYENILYGGYLYAGSISGVKLLTSNMDKLRGKRIIVFAVGCAPERKENNRHIISRNFSGNLRENISFFYLRGAFNYQELGLLDKFLIYILKAKIKHTKPEKLDEDSKEFLELCEKPMDWTNLDAIKPILSFITQGK